MPLFSLVSPTAEPVVLVVSPSFLTLLLSLVVGLGWVKSDVREGGSSTTNAVETSALSLTSSQPVIVVVTTGAAVVDGSTAAG